jgi:hypothetical protein
MMLSFTIELLIVVLFPMVTCGPMIEFSITHPSAILTGAMMILLVYNSGLIA